jgi:hypothetical protein
MAKKTMNIQMKITKTPVEMQDLTTQIAKTTYKDLRRKT